MTYLTGLEAKTVIWIAPEFRDEHLSAVRWLNEHTVEPFSFFAIRVRVVKIGSSPLAPLFDVLEQPNEWDRRLHAKTINNADIDVPDNFSKEFWAFFDRKYSEIKFGNTGRGGKNYWISIPEAGLVLSIWANLQGVGLFVRGPKGQSTLDSVIKLNPHILEIAGKLDASATDSKFPLIKKTAIDLSNRLEWDRAAEWIYSQANLYVSCLSTHPFTETEEGDVSFLKISDDSQQIGDGAP